MHSNPDPGSPFPTPPDPAGRDAHGIEAALTDAARTLSAAGAVQPLGGHCWLIETASGEGILAEWSTDRQRLVLTAEVGRPTPEQEGLAHQAALTCNGWWHRQGGLRLVREAEGALLLVTDLHEAELTLPALAADLARFEAVRALWSAALENLDPIDAEASAPDTADGPAA